MKWNIRCLAAAVMLLAVRLPAAERWQMQYLYDEDKSSLVINDLCFPSAKRGIAVGYTTAGREGRPKGVALLTSDGGSHWTLQPVQEVGTSLFFLNDSEGWMVTPKGLFHTEESGRSWKKINAPSHVLRVYFLDSNHGWAAGAEKSIHETHDGGKKWTKVPAADEPSTNPKYTVYSSIEFVNRDFGIISGWSQPPRRAYERDLPPWLEPEKAVRHSELPSVTISLETHDAGKTWKASSASVFGRVARIRLSPRGTGLALVEFTDAFRYPSEVYAMDLVSGKNSRAYREKNMAVTDMALPVSGPAYLAAIEVPGELRNLPIPGKLRILASSDLKTWKPLPVDYRAVGGRAILAAPDPGNLWVALDTGMILRLQP